MSCPTKLFSTLTIVLEMLKLSYMGILAVFARNEHSCKIWLSCPSGIRVVILSNCWYCMMDIE